MKNILTILLSAVCLATLLTTLIQAQEDELIFQERFINTTATNADFASLGWSAYILDPNTESVALDVSTLEDQPHASLTGISGNTGYETCFCDDDLGLVFQWTGDRTTWLMLVYDEFTLDRSQMEITRVLWADRSGDTGAPFDQEIRFAVKIDGQWYATATGYDPHPGDTEETWGTVEHTFTTTGADWRHLDFEPGTVLELGETVDGSLPDGNIEAIGFHFFHPPYSPHGSIRFDDVEIYAKAAQGGGDNGGGDTLQWAGYVIVEQDGKQLVDTGDWMGWLDVTSAPWIFPFSLNSWIYLEEEAVGEDGAWAYAVK